jgi:DNA-binding PadR family transcriptional regulator
MSIKLAILGILSWKPSTGYELKNIFEDSSFMYWSGNNNQIYKALINLENEDLVTSKVVHQDKSLSKKYIA